MLYKEKKRRQYKYMLIIVEVNDGKWVCEVFYNLFSIFIMFECCHHEKNNKPKYIQVKFN